MNLDDLKERVLRGLYDDVHHPDSRALSEARKALEELVEECVTMRRWAEEAAAAENANALDAQKERAAVVAWLRAEARMPGASPDEKRLLNSITRDIERGEHRREGEV
jgi:hypothetical protein